MNRLQCVLKSLICISLFAVLLGCAPLVQSPAVMSSEDSLITNKVHTAFFSEPSLRTSHIRVNTTKGVVFLMGDVEKTQDVETAKEIAGSIPGVVKVKSQLVIKE